MLNTFQFTHPGKGATSKTIYQAINYLGFQFTHPGKGATRRRKVPIVGDCVSIHAPWEGCDVINTSTLMASIKFQFTHPGKGATIPPKQSASVIRRFNSRTLGRVRLSEMVRWVYDCYVSIHAPWEGCDDRQRHTALLLSACFNSRTLGRVRHILTLLSTDTTAVFQFTHPGKGATSSTIASSSLSFCFNSRTLGRVRRPLFGGFPGRKRVSIHAPWEGCDKIIARLYGGWRVSIHAPWEGCDRSASCSGFVFFTFQFTHPGKGATAMMIALYISLTSFNSRTLGRVRLILVAFIPHSFSVSIHAPWEGCDILTWSPRTKRGGFNSRTLGRVRRVLSSEVSQADKVSIHAPWEGCDRV